MHKILYLNKKEQPSQRIPFPKNFPWNSVEGAVNIEEQNKVFLGQ